MDIDELEKDIAQIYGLDYFETVSYSVVIENDKTGIVIHAVERSTGLDSVRFGLNLESDFDGDSDFNISARYQQEGINEHGGELIVEVIAGEKLGAAARLLQPLDPATRYFVSGGLSYLERDVFVFQNGRRLGEIRVRALDAELVASAWHVGSHFRGTGPWLWLE